MHTGATRSAQQGILEEFVSDHLQIPQERGNPKP